MKEDAKAGKYLLKKGTRVMVWIGGLHNNPAEWQRPREFLPERFDPESPLYLTPSGKRRSMYSFIPFFGGRRICLGKTFAELSMKIATTYLS